MSGTNLEEFRTSPEMRYSLLKNTTFYQTPTLLRGVWYIGYKSKRNYPTGKKITKPTARKLFFKDIEDLENYHLIKKLSKEIGQHFYDVCVSFAFDYGTTALKNSKLFYFLKKQDIDNSVKELERYLSNSGIFEPDLKKKREFEIYVLKNNIYNKKEKNYDSTERYLKKDVGFRY